MESRPLLIILGPTASGKTKLAVTLADHFNGEIISADSRQVFRDMDIGTGKDLAEYHINGKTIHHHLIDIRAAGENYNVNAFKDDFFSAFEQINNKDKLPILCGGTGMYIHSLLQNQEFTAVPVNALLRDGLANLSKSELIERLHTYPDPSTNHADLTSAKRLIRAIEIAEFLLYHQLPIVERPTLHPLIIGLTSTVETRRELILNRLEQRLNDGLITEVETLLANGVAAEMLTYYGLEYKFVVMYLMGEIDKPTLKDKLGIAICQFAKRQMTFFRKMEKDGVLINWLSTEAGFDALRSEAIKLTNNNLLARQTF